MSRAEIEGISGWCLIAPLLENAPPWIVELSQNCQSPIEQTFVCALGLAVLTTDPAARPTITVQVPIKQYFADIVIIGTNGAPRVVVECDGAEFHKDKARDTKRTAIIEGIGYRVLRVTGSEIYNNPLARARSLLREIGLLPVPQKTIQPP